MRLGTFEEWYAWEGKRRASKKVWHYPTRLSLETTEDLVIRQPERVFYRTLGVGTDWDKENKEITP